MAPTLRDPISASITQACAKDKNVVFAILIADNQLVTLVRMKKYFLHPADLHLIFNLVNNSESFKVSETWMPICLPKFDSRLNNQRKRLFFTSWLLICKCFSGFMQAHVSYLKEDHPACLIMLTVERNIFYEISETKKAIVQVLFYPHLFPSRLKFKVSLELGKDQIFECHHRSLGKESLQSRLHWLRNPTLSVQGQDGSSIHVLILCRALPHRGRTSEASQSLFEAAKSNSFLTTASATDLSEWPEGKCYWLGKSGWHNFGLFSSHLISDVVDRLLNPLSFTPAWPPPHPRPMPLVASTSCWGGARRTSKPCSSWMPRLISQNSPRIHYYVFFNWVLETNKSLSLAEGQGW